MRERNIDRIIKSVLFIAFFLVSPIASFALDNSSQKETDRAYGLLSEEAYISVLESAPYDAEVFTVFGHAAFRVNDPKRQYDAVFNYGIFDYSSSNFIWRFALGHTDYKLEAELYPYYMRRYKLQGSDVTEQILNLSEKEKNNLFHALLENAKPENCVYRYNFFFDNCATRLPMMVEKYTQGEVIYHHTPSPLSFRDMVHDCTKGHAWLTFGIDLALGIPSDRIATPHEMMFLPHYMKESFANASLFTPDGIERELVSKTNVVQSLTIEKEDFDLLEELLTPIVASWLLFALIATMTIIGWKRKREYRGIDILLFSLAGLAGCVLFFLCFISVHPCIWPNWSVVWLHPFHLIGIVLFSIGKKGAYYYHFINFAALSLLLIGWYFIPQQMNAAFIPLILTLWLRSGSKIIKR